MDIEGQLIQLVQQQALQFAQTLLAGEMADVAEPDATAYMLSAAGYQGLASLATQSKFESGLQTHALLDMNQQRFSPPMRVCLHVNAESKAGESGQSAQQSVPQDGNQITDFLKQQLQNQIKQRCLSQDSSTPGTSSGTLSGALQNAFTDEFSGKLGSQVMDGSMDSLGQVGQAEQLTKTVPKSTVPGVAQACGAGVLQTQLRDFVSQQLSQRMTDQLLSHVTGKSKSMSKMNDQSVESQASATVDGQQRMIGADAVELSITQQLQKNINQRRFFADR